MTEAVVIIGATSGIGRALARAVAQEGRGVVLAGRDVPDLERTAADCRVRFGVPSRVEPLDALDFSSHAAFAERASKGFGVGVAGFIACHGVMPAEAEARDDPAVLRRLVDTNYTSMISLFERAVEQLAPHGGGFLCALSSVAGDRGRPGNHIYGSSKAAVSAYLSGLRARVAASGIRVVDVRPGIVDTAMTWGLPDLPPLHARPAVVARATLRGIARDRAVVYTPGYWRVVMALIRAIPDRVFKQLDL